VAGLVTHTRAGWWRRAGERGYRPAVIARWPFARLLLVVLVLLANTACLEHVEALKTRVVYDPFTQTFAVRRTLIGVEAQFLACGDVAECVEAIERALSVDPASTLSSFALSDRLLQRLVDSGAQDLKLTLHRERDRLDVLVDYVAPVGSPAADDTMVRAEWKGGRRLFKRGHYYLVVDAQDRIAPPGRYRSRKVARSSSEGIDWVEEWVLPRWKRSVETLLPVGEAEPLFERFPDLAAELESRGWLDQPAELKGGDEPEAPRLAQVSKASRTDAALPAEATSESGARAWFYEARITGGGVTPASAAVAIEPLQDDLGRCYHDRQRAVPDLAGSVFLSALVRPDGTVIGTAVNSNVADPELVSCMEQALVGLQFAAWGEQGDGVSDVVIPMVLRVEGETPRR
jgi:hypothetical protein